MTDLETMLRTSLHDRAEDVEPTPELWRSVQRKAARRRAMPLLVWTAAGVAAAVTAVAVVPGLVERMDEGFVIDPAQSPTAPASPGEEAPGPVAAAPLTHYVAVVDGRLVLRSVAGAEEVLWEGEAQVQNVAVAPSSTPEDLFVLFVTEAEGTYDLRMHRRSFAGTSSGVIVGNLVPGVPSSEVAPPQPVWNPAGSHIAWVGAGGNGEAVLDVVEASFLMVDGEVDGVERATAPLAGVEEPGTGRREPAALRLQDWASVGGEEVLSFTTFGELYRAPIAEVGEGWDVGVLERADGGDYVVDIATADDGTQYRLLAGGSTSGDAEDAGLALEFDNERIEFPELQTGDPSGAWMTAVEGGAFVGLGSDARMVHRDPEGNSPHAGLTGVSYAAWVPGAGDADDVPKGAPTPDAAEAPADPAPSSTASPYVAIQEMGRVAVVTDDGGEREVIISEQQLADLGAGTPVDVTVRPGSTADEVAGVLLLDGGDGRELAWFRAAAGATAIYRMEGATGLGTDGLEQRDAPTWSPDGRHIAWVEPSDEGGWTLRTVGMADDGPTTADAGFGIDVQGDRPRVADWMWESSGDGATRGSILVVGAGGTYTVAIERQGDGALAVGGTVAMPSDGEEGDVVDAGFRDGELISLWVVGGDVRVRQPGAADALLPLAPPADLGELDLDVSRDVVVVTYRGPAAAFVVGRDGDVEPLEVEAHGFDPVR